MRRRVYANLHDPEKHTPPSQGIHPEDFRVTDTEMARQFDPVALAESKKLHQNEDFQGQASNERMVETVETQQGSVEQLPVDLFLSSMNTLKLGNDTLGEKIDRLAELISGLLDDAYKSRVPEEQMYPISQAVEITVDYKQRKFLYLYATGTITLATSNGVNLNIVAGWNQIALPQGTKITASSIPAATPIFMLVRATDQRIV